MAKESFLSSEFVDSGEESDRGAATKKRKYSSGTLNGATGASAVTKSKKNATETKTKKLAAEKKPKEADTARTKPVKVESTPVPILKGTPKRPTTGSSVPAPKSSTKKVQFTKESKPKSTTKIEKEGSASSEDSSSSEEQSESDSSSEEETKPQPTQPTPAASDSDEESSDSSDEESSSGEEKKPVAIKNAVRKMGSSPSEASSSEEESADNEDVEMADPPEADEDDSEDESEESTSEPSGPKTAQAVQEVIVAPYRPPEGFAPISVSGQQSKMVGQLFNTDGSSTKTFWHITAPSSVPLSKLKSLLLDDISSGKELLTHNNIKYGLAEGGSGGKSSLLLPQNKGYAIGGAKISRVLHVQPVIGTTGASASTNGEASGVKYQYKKEKPRNVQPEGLRMRYRPSGIGSDDLGRICPSDSEEDVELASETPKFKAPPTPNGESRKRKAEQALEDAGRSPEKKKSKKKKVKEESEEVESVTEKKKSKNKSKKGDHPSSDALDVAPSQDDANVEGGKREKKKKKAKSEGGVGSSQTNGDAATSPVKAKKSKKSKEKKSA